MRFIRIAGFLFLISITCLVGIAQTTPTPLVSGSPEDADKKKKLDTLIQQTLDEMSTGATSLRLPENRAIVDGMSGDMYWQYDQKRARELFRTAGAELATYNVEMEKQQAADNGNARGGGRFGGFGDFAFIGDPRFQVIPLIAKHDAGLAMQIMLQTRRQAVSEAMASTTTRSNGGRGGRGGGNGPGGGNIDASQEMALQQQIATLAADQDPDLAVKLIKDSMANGVNAGVLPLLQKLAKLDDKKAADLGSDVVRKVVDSDMVASQDPMRTDINFLQYSTRLQPSTDPSIKQFNFTDAQQKDLADKLVTTLMAMPQTAAANNWFNQVIPLVDKIEPGRSAVLKQRQADIQSTAQTGNSGRGASQRQALFNASTTPEQILAQLPSIPEAQRGTAYAALGSKIGSMTDDAAAQKLVDQISDENERSDLQQQLDNSRAAKAIQSGNLDDARKQIASITDHRQQLQRYVALAIAYAQSGAENDVKTAKTILRDAKASTSPYPDNGDDLSDLMELVRGYAVVEPEAAFKMVEPGVDLLNEYVQATAVLSKFNRDRQFRNGELVFRMSGQGGGPFGGGGGSVLFRYVSQMQSLGKADLERANQLLDRLSRPDARMILRLYVLQGAIPDAPVAAQTSAR